ncbi:hypothetical protein [Flavobacterium restrictum]|uniref:hypothetical protein n=1 Tax=Flavobacterium restrictum TaxID=2594428 RepID=UPI00163D7C60|nr:hypothetical protein [Flavobacterium restrictum]
MVYRNVFCSIPNGYWALFEIGFNFFKAFKLKLVTLDHPEELFAVLNEIEEAYAGYEVV